MNFPFDCITYDDNQFTLKPNNNTFDPDFSLSSPAYEDLDNNLAFPPFPRFPAGEIVDLLNPEVDDNKHESMFSHILNSSEQTESPSEEPFISPEPSELTDDQEPKGKKSRSKINQDSKKITKREPKKKAEPKKKERTKAKKVSTEVLLQKADPKYIPTEMNDPDLDGDTKKRMVQMIRNRISAQNSRDRKKFYIQQLEEMRDVLDEENTSLITEKKSLLEKIKKLEEDKELLVHEISSLKKSLPPLCSGCGVTIDYGNLINTLNQDTTEGTSSQDGSDESSPLLLQRGTSRLGRGFFGFSMTFTALLCLFFVLSTGQYKGGKFLSGNKNLMNGIATLPVDRFRMETCKKADGEEDVVKMDYEFTQTTALPQEEVFAKVNFEFGSQENQILNKVRHLMDQFDNFHQFFYQTYEKNKMIVDISKEEIPDAKVLAASQAKQNNRRNFLEKLSPITNPIKAKNRTSTLFCPNGFEFFKANSTFVPGSETIPPSANNTQNGLEIGSKTLDIEKAEYVQLVIPRHSIGRLGVAENSSEINYMPTIQEEEQTSLIEVWCKVFAVRDLATSL